jgi:hypothetical protein
MSIGMEEEINRWLAQRPLDAGNWVSDSGAMLYLRCSRMFSITSASSVQAMSRRRRPVMNVGRQSAPHQTLIAYTFMGAVTYGF